jgi:hypothetical protein
MARKIKDFVIISAIVWVFFVITSCAGYRAKMQKKYCSADTVKVMVHDTIRTETVRTDTIFHESVDSVTIVKDKLKIVYKKVRDSVYISGECEGDTIYISKEISVPVQNKRPSFWELAKEYRFPLLIIFILGLLLGFYLTKK